VSLPLTRNTRNFTANVYQIKLPLIYCSCVIHFCTRSCSELNFWVRWKITSPITLASINIFSVYSWICRNVKNSRKHGNKIRFQTENKRLKISYWRVIILKQTNGTKLAVTNLYKYHRTPDKIVMWLLRRKISVLRYKLSQHVKVFFSCILLLILCCVWQNKTELNWI